MVLSTSLTSSAHTNNAWLTGLMVYLCRSFSKSLVTLVICTGVVWIPLTAATAYHLALIATGMLGTKWKFTTSTLHDMNMKHITLAQTERKLAVDHFVYCLFKVT